MHQDGNGKTEENGKAEANGKKDGNSRKTEDVRPSSRRRTGGRKHSVLPLIIFLLCILILGGTAGGYVYYKKYAPSKEPADLKEYFGVTGNTALVYLNDERAKQDDLQVLAKVQDGSVFLPFNWVRDHLNRRFYWESDSQQFLYSLPTETVATSIGDTLLDGSLAFMADGDTLYLNVDFIKKYTDIRYHAHTDTDQKRIFIYNDWKAETQAVINKKEQVRLKGGVKSPVLTSLSQGDTVTVLNTMDSWSEVSTQDGFIGYVRNKRLSDIKDVTPVSDFSAPDYTHITRQDGSKVVLGFHQVTNLSANATFADATANAASMNVIAPTWFVLSSNDGDFMSYASAEYVASAHAKGYQVWATVNNFDLGDIDETSLFPSQGKRAQLISGLMDVVKKTGIDGLNIDFEQVPSDAGRAYVQFIRELSVACRNAGVILSADTYVPYEFNSYYDIEELGVYCDYVVIMCYDEHYAGGDAGSVASIGYVDKGIQEAAAVIDKSRVIIGVPFYTRVWITKGGKTSSDALGAADALKWAETNKVQLTWDDTAGQNVGSLQEGDAVKKVWMEDEKSMQLKLDHIRTAGVGGVAAWKLTQEPADFWNILNLNQK